MLNESINQSMFPVLRAGGTVKETQLIGVGFNIHRFAVRVFWEEAARRKTFADLMLAILLSTARTVL